MTETQQSLFALLVELDDICKKHQITYYLIGGSALGAIRHHGFLPWDDDADIVMTRDNWEKLKKAFETDLPPDRACVSWENCPEEPSVFYRYVNTSQTFILHSLWDHRMPWGGIIDIFVLNPLPSNPKKWAAYHRAMRRFGEYVMNSMIVVNDKCSIILYLWDFLTGKIKGQSTVRRNLYRYLERYSEEKCTHYSYLYARLHLVYPKEIFQEPRYVPFEGRLMPVPTLVEEHFRLLFGDDWYNVPDDSDTIIHNAAHDNRRSYEEYMYDYLHYARRARVRKYALTAKVLKMFRCKLLHLQDWQVSRLRSKYLRLLFEKQYLERREELENLSSNGDFRILQEIFTPYFDEQLLPIMVSSQTWIPVPEAYWALALRTLIFSGYSRKAEKIMGIYMASHGSPSAFWEELSGLIAAKNQLFLAYERAEWEAAEALADSLFASWPYDKDIRLVYLWLKLEHGASYRRDLMMAEVLEGERQWPDAMEFVALHASLLVRSRAYDDANQLYEKARKNTRNGMLLLAMQENGFKWEAQANNDRYTEGV